MLNKNIIFDTSSVKSFYEENNNLINLVNANVTYIGIIGLINGNFLCKYGLSSRIFDRDLSEHKKTFGDQFKIVHIFQTDNNKLVEKSFKKILKLKGLHCDGEFSGKNQTELFVTNDNFNLTNAIDLMQEIADDNNVKIIRNDNEIQLMMLKEKTKQMELNLLIEREKTKQEEEKTKQQMNITMQTGINWQIKQEENDIKTKDIYLRFLDEKTIETNKKHIHCTVIYKEFTEWCIQNNLNEQIPCHRIFVNTLRNYIDIDKVRVNNKIAYGVKNLALL